MPNEVFLRTHDGLAGMVSARAATKVLEDALRSTGTTAEAVTLQQMTAMLQGPVLRDLERILPREGLKRNLSSLIAVLEADLAPSGATPTVVQTPPAGTVAQDLARTLVEGTVRPPPEPPAPPLPAAELERLALSFGRIDQVQLVLAARQDGSVVVSRGSGPDPAVLARMGMLALTLLKRSGRLRSYYLGHPAGQLFTFPFGTDAIIVVGGPDLNLGAVFSAFAGLVAKEES